MQGAEGEGTGPMGTEHLVMSQVHPGCRHRRGLRGPSEYFREVPLVWLNDLHGSIGLDERE